MVCVCVCVSQVGEEEKGKKGSCVKAQEGLQLRMDEVK